MMILGVAFAGRIWYNVAINTKGLLRFLALSTVWDKFRLRFGIQQTLSRICGTPSACPAQVGRFFCLRRSRQAARDAKPVNGFFVSHGKQKGLLPRRVRKGRGPKPEAAK